MSVAIFTSPPLSLLTKAITHRYFPSAKIFVWERGDSSALSAIRADLLSRHWLACISVYNDYVFGREEIANIKCIVNIHPALPDLRGRGYDIIPLLNQDAIHGATLHFVSESIDAGKIIDVISQPIPEGISYLDFRARNQQLCLRMLENLLGICKRHSLEKLPTVLNQVASTSSHVWKGSFTSSAKLAAVLSELRGRYPQHPMLLQLPDSLLEGT